VKVSTRQAARTTCTSSNSDRGVEGQNFAGYLWPGPQNPCHLAALTLTTLLGFIIFPGIEEMQFGDFEARVRLDLSISAQCAGRNRACTEEMCRHFPGVIVSVNRMWSRV